MGARQRSVPIIRVPRLNRLAGLQTNGQAGRQHANLSELMPCPCPRNRVRRQLGKYRILRQHRIDPVCPLALKNIAPLGHLFDPGRPRLPLSRKHCRIEQLGNDAKALGIEGVDQPLCTITWQMGCQVMSQVLRCRRGNRHRPNFMRVQ